MNWYAFFLLSGILLYFAFVFLQTRKYNMETYKSVILTVMDFSFILLGAKLLAMAQEHSSDVLKTGFSSYGGLIGIVVSTLLFIMLTSVPARQIFIVSLMPVPLVYGVGKIGCFIAGCCNGITINGTTVPVQLIEAVSFLLVFVLFYRIYNSRQFTVNYIYSEVLVCAIIKGTLYYLRQESVGNPFGSHQWLCVASVVLVVFLLVYGNVKKPEKMNNN
ncbi:MAG: prolipoprotein diacylglyceryl transferase family protein [Eubacterium sp.]